MSGSWECYVGPSMAAVLASREDGPLGDWWPGHIENLGQGRIRLDEMAVQSLTDRTWDVDGRVTWEDDVPVLHIGTDRHPMEGT